MRLAAYFIRIAIGRFWTGLLLHIATRCFYFKIILWFIYSYIETIYCFANRSFYSFVNRITSTFSTVIVALTCVKII